MKPLLRPEKIVINVSAAEKNEICRMAQIYGLPTSVYARMALLGYIEDDKRGLKYPLDGDKDADGS